ncbi:MAG: DNA ligase, partial [Clostridia bacterium]|nr:DNA ligase [Clostridia bacterium]
MSKMSEMSATIEELRNVCNELERVRIAISNAADWLAEWFGGSKPESEAASTESVLTLETVRAVLAGKSREGFTEEIRSLLLKYGAQK